MSLHFSNPQGEVDKIVSFLRAVFQRNHKNRAVIAVSGGIDSALALTLLVRALGKEKVTAVLLPHHQQPMADAQMLVEYLQLPQENVRTIDIKPAVDAVAAALHLSEEEVIRRGNLKARMRMICVFDIAKSLDGLVCGTENKSEHYLGYFTRFGDAASDIEPICHLYKTQVRQLVEFLQLPPIFLEKQPSAGLWIGQTDEEEMGFTYEIADQILEQYIDNGKAVESISVGDLSREKIEKVISQVNAMKFKLEVPYVVRE